MKTEPIIPPYFFVFDVESIGLHGEGYAVGFSVVTWAGCEVEFGVMSINPDNALGEGGDRKWVSENVPAMEMTHNTTHGMRSTFWHAWMFWKDRGAVMVTDCGWPVEANFLSKVISDDIGRKWLGPYPLHDIASIILAHGGDPLATLPRLPHEFPAHNPLNDARQSARVMLGYLQRLEPSPMTATPPVAGNPSEAATEEKP